MIEMSNSVPILPKPPESAEAGWSVSLRARKRAKRCYECVECQSRFSSNTALKTHERICLGDNMEMLNICNYCLTLHACADTLQAHKAAQHCDGKYLCLRCGKCFACRGHLRNHMVHMHAQQTLQYSCMICALEGEAPNFSSKRELCAHYQAIHCELLVSGDNAPTAANEHEYPISDICFDDNDNDDEMQDLEWLDDCVNVGFDFDLGKVLNGVGSNAGSSSTTAPTAPYSCPVCECACVKAASLMQHVAKAHDAEPLVCIYCQKSFDKSVNYKRHLERMHTLLPRHECFFCKRSFSNMDHLKKHVLGLHQNERNFFCGLCKAGFTQSVHLRQHLDTHTRHKRFTCDLCSRSYWRRIDLQRHCCNKPTTLA